MQFSSLAQMCCSSQFHYSFRWLCHAQFIFFASSFPRSCHLWGVASELCFYANNRYENNFAQRLCSGRISSDANPWRTYCTRIKWRCVREIVLNWPACELRIWKRARLTYICSDASSKASVWVSVCACEHNGKCMFAKDMKNCGDKERTEIYYSLSLGLANSTVRTNWLARIEIKT